MGTLFEKKRLIFVLVSLIVFMGAMSASAQNIPKMELKLGHVLAAGGADDAQAVQVFINLVKEKSKGQIIIANYPGSQLGDWREQFEALALGTPHMMYEDIMSMAYLDPIVNLTNPFLFDNSDEYFYIFEKTPLGQQILDAVAQKTKRRAISVMYRGHRNMIAVRPFRNPGETKGLKLRVPNIDVYIDTMKAMGLNPTPMPFSEVFTGLQTKVVEGVENPTATFFDEAWYDVAKHVMKTGHLMELEAIICYEPWWQQQSPAVKTIITESVQEAAHKYADWYAKNEQSYFDKLKGKGCQIYDVDKEAFREATKNVRVAESAQVWVDKMKVVVKEYRAKKK